MSSGFVSGGTIEHPNERDDEWRRAQAELEETRRLKAEASQQNNGKSLYEVLQANKDAKQEAFEEATRLKNQYRALDDDEAEFLDSILESTRKKEADVKKETLEQLDAFRRRQEEAERKAFEEEQGGEGKKEGKGDESHWVMQGRKRKKGHELLKGVKLRRGSSGAEGKEAEKAGQSGTEQQTPDATPKAQQAPVAVAKASPIKPPSTSPPAKPSGPIALGLGYASSDEDD